MARKILNKNSPGTSTTWASDDWDYPNKYLTGVDQSALDPVLIATNTTFWDNRLRVYNPARTKSYRIRGLAILNDYDLTLPLISSNDEFVGLLATQTLQNKIINVNNNTIKHGTTNAIGDLLVGTGSKYDRLAMGSTGGYVLAVKNDLTGLEWVAAAGGGGGEANTASNVGTAGVGMFKLKSGVDLQFKKLNVASGGLITVTDDTANNEVDLKITAGTDGQFLKTVGSTPTWTTLTSQYGRIMPDGSNYSGARYGAFLGGAGDGDGLFGGLQRHGNRAATHVPTATRTRFTTSGEDLDTAGWDTDTMVTTRSQNPKYKVRFAADPITERCFVGFINDTEYPGGFDPGANHHGLVIGWDTSDTNFVAKWNNGTSSSQVAASSVAKDALIHTAELWIVDSPASVSAWLDGVNVVNASTLKVPNSTEPLAIHNKVQAIGTTVTAMNVEYAMLTFP